MYRCTTFACQQTVHFLEQGLSWDNEVWQNGWPTTVVNLFCEDASSAANLHLSLRPWRLRLHPHTWNLHLCLHQNGQSAHCSTNTCPLLSRHHCISAECTHRGLSFCIPVLGDCVAVNLMYTCCYAAGASVCWGTEASWLCVHSSNEGPPWVYGGEVQRVQEEIWQSRWCEGTFYGFC